MIRVKNLEWVGNDPNRFKSQGALYEYVITHDGDEPDEWSVRRDGKLLSYHETEELARKSAQENYERRVLSALSLTEPGA